MQAPSVSVVVPSWNGLRFLPTLLEALAAQTHRGLETIVVDNGSSDGSARLLAESPGIRLVALERNRGFAAAANRGSREATTDLILFLNNDMEPEPGFVAAFVDAAERHPEVGSFACRVLFRDDPGRIDSAGDRLTRSGRSLGIGRGEVDGPRFEVERAVFGGTGGAVLYRRHVLEAAGHFDEDFFLYVEDTDLAFRAQLLGFRCLYVPAARTLHVGSGSMRGREDLRARYCLRNHLFLLLKDYPLRLLFRHRREIFRGLVIELVAAFGASRVKRGGIRAALVVLLTLADVVRLAPLMLLRRLRLRRRVSLAAVAALLE